MVIPQVKGNKGNMAYSKNYFSVFPYVSKFIFFFWCLYSIDLPYILSITVFVCHTQKIFEILMFARLCFSFWNIFIFNALDFHERKSDLHYYHSKSNFTCPYLTKYMQHMSFYYLSFCVLAVIISTFSEIELNVSYKNLILTNIIQK